MSLSLPLYVVQGGITTKNINEDKNNKGIQITNKAKEIKIPQYADNPNVYLRQEQSIEAVLNYFKNAQYYQKIKKKLETSNKNFLISK